MKIVKKKTLIGGALIMGSFSALYFALPPLTATIYDSSVPETEKGMSTSTHEIKKEPEFVVTHVKTPNVVKAIYMTQCVAGTRDFRARLVDLVDTTELNSIVIDIKDYSGRISFRSDNPLLKDKLSPTCRADDMMRFIGTLHEKGVYVIGRITVFQDPYFSKMRPDLAIKKSSDKESVWKDKKGISYIDPGAHEAWEYISTLAKESYKIGFDEINFDYIRFPSDGNMQDIYFPWSAQALAQDPAHGKATVLKNFFSYTSEQLRSSIPNIVLSADLFGMTTTNTDDLNIGQVIENAALYFDYIAPMVYPSHYPPTFHGFKNPADHPYEVVKFSMDSAVTRLNAASTTPLKLRPWLQDFNLGAVYTADMVRAQTKATYDAGLTSWMLWNAGNTYTKGALENK
ncbi:MAG: hypothetical protein HZB09_00280 [Candidatus Yonathbacteria bacterium]|nr:hypothetical protein [Candidatus Yonathbacteria bacterium]